MSKGFKHGAGGSPLNFKVVAYATEEELNAASPKDNAIGVITQNDITGWHFTSEQPENMAEGEVWFSVGTESAASFNALKKNNIQVCPVSAKQYVSGEWVDVIAMSYQNGEWVSWITDEYLYNVGNQCTDITGGWSTNLPVSNTASSGAMFRTSDIYLGLDRSSGSTSYTVSVFTKNKIKLDNVDKIKFVIPTFSGSKNFARCGVYASSVTSPAAFVAINSTGTFEVDTSNITGEHYVFAAIYTGWGASGAMDTRFYVSEVIKTGRG